MPSWRSESRAPGYLSLFASAGTLLCCALPSLLVVLGFGATVASVLSAAPLLVELSRNKSWVFAIAGLALAGSWYFEYRLAPRPAIGVACPPGHEEACAAARRGTRILLMVSGAIYLVGLFVAYGLGPLLGE